MQPITGVTVENYQSIGAADLKFGKLNVIVGRGNLGKSALLRAITAAIFNETGSDFIRQGTKQCNVTLRFDGDQEVTWIKTEKTARYEVDIAGAKTEFTKLAGGVPSELRDLFGIHTIEIDNTFSITPQVHGQFDMPILIGESGSKAARALAKLTKLEFVLQAQTSAAKDLRRAKQDATARAREVSELEARLKEFPDIPAIEKLLAKARTAVAEVDERLNLLADAEDIYERMMRAKKRIKTEPPSLGDLGSIVKRLDTMQNALIFQQVHARAEEAVKVTEFSLEEANVELENAQAELDTYMASLGVCPLCGQELTENHHDA